jgi:hypothetical protein
MFASDQVAAAKKKATVSISDQVAATKKNNSIYQRPGSHYEEGDVSASDQVATTKKYTTVATPTPEVDRPKRR